nr:type VI secretion system baseplate subunit TssG [Sagittula salina]
MPPGLDPLEQQEWRALGKGLFVLLRELERRAGGKPRIGRNTRLHDRVVKLGQDPFLGMPHAEVARYDPSQSIPVVRAQFMGFFGPHGAFPLNWTEEVHRWFRAGDASFVAFVDIFTARFQELFFRAWSDARAITQFDHAEGDRFEAYMLSFTGNGTPAMQGRDALSDTVKARYAGLSGGRVKSPTRLRQMLQLHFDGKLRVEIEELVPTWLDFEPDTLSKLGMQACGMGMNMHLGSRVRSVGEKIRVHLYVHSITHYFDLLPGGHDHGHLRDLVHWYLGEAYETEVVIWLPQTEIQPAVMGVSAQLGWMACLSPPKGDPDVMVQVTVFKLLPPKGDQREAA